MAETGQALVDEGSPGPLSIPKMLHFLGYGAYKVVVPRITGGKGTSQGFPQGRRPEPC